jgi:Flp pilus assembly protein TadD/4-amino-4-deoxy-L-arabinose transferase-like glycosyltransferase
LLVVFLIAATVRLIYLTEYRDVPYFDHPYGDSGRYQQRALEIVSGDVLGEDVYFLGSPFYPYFLAGVYKMFGVNFAAVRLIQFLLGSATCALIFLLARRISGKHPYNSFLAGLLAAGYGTMVFFDGTLLATSLELFFTCASLLLLTISCRHRDRGEVKPDPVSFHGGVGVFAAGLVLGLAGLGRPNILVFAPFALLWIFTGFRKTAVRSRWRRGILFTLGCILAVAPVTIRNYAVAKDFVPVTSSAGINFYIGNNEQANGCLSIPAGSGLSVSLLGASSRAAAEAATGRTGMKPSEVSRYWTKRGMEFVRRNPGDAARLLLRKLGLFWNHYEIPNVHNKDFVANSYAPSLRWFFVGFGLIVPLALIGVIVVLRDRSNAAGARLYLGFVLVYLCSLLPFFVTARYRMPVVPILVVFASAGIVGIVDLARKRSFAWLGVLVLAGGGAALLVNRTVLESSFWLSRAMVGVTHAEIAAERPEDAPRHLHDAVIELKKAIELAPHVAESYYNLGMVYYQIGFYSGAAEQFDKAMERDPGHVRARSARAQAQTELQKTGDIRGAGALPLTPFEQAARLLGAGQVNPALFQLQRAVEEDPQHAWAYNQMGSIYFNRGDYETALDAYKKALRYSRNNAVLLGNIASTYYKLKDFNRARRYWEESLGIDPKNEQIIQHLKNLPER